MKNNLFIALAFCLATTFAFAQKITGKDLQGTLEHCSLSASGIQYELATDKLTLSDEMKAFINEDAMQGMKQAAAQLEGGFTDLDATTIKMGMAGSSETNVYTLTEKEGKQYLTLKLEDGTTQEMPVVLLDKKLHITVDRTQNFSMIFTKG